VYAIAIAIGYLVGSSCARVIAPSWSLDTSFISAGVISTVTGLVVWWRLDPDVRYAEDHPGKGSGEPLTPYRTLAWRIKTSLFGTFAYGYFQASAVLFLPLYLMEEKGIARDRTFLVPAFFAFGMLAFTVHAGRLGDRFGHLLVMRALGLVGTVVVLGFVALDSYWAMGVVITAAGATLAAISPVSLALQGVIAKPRDYSRSNAIYNVFYASGMLLGPLLSAILYGRAGGGALIGHLAALWACFVAFTVVFARDDPAHRYTVVPVPSSPSH
jgi:MFS family permease